MIRFALPEEKQVIYRIWKEVFSFDDKGYTDFYFHHVFDEKNTLVKVVDNVIVSTLQRIPHVMVLHDKKISCHFIVGVATIPPERNKGYMRELMLATLDEISYKSLVTILQAYDPKQYLQYGFEMVYYRKKYYFSRESFPKYATGGIGEKVDYQQLARLHKDFMQSFNGYLERDGRYYQRLEKRLEEERGFLYTYYKDDILEGYMVCYLEANHIVVDEIIYRSGETLARLLAYACKQKPYVQLFVSQFEDFSKLLPDAEVEQIDCMMAKINDKRLFEQCFGISASNIKEAFKNKKKPLYINENA